MLHGEFYTLFITVLEIRRSHDLHKKFYAHNYDRQEILYNNKFQNFKLQK